MRSLSIKIQLTIWYSLTIFVVSAMLFASFYYITKRSIILETDRSLLSHASQISDNIALNTNNVFDSQTQEIIDVSKSQIPGIFIALTDVAGHHVRSEEDGTFLKLALQSIKTKKETYANQSVNGTNLRLISYPIIKSGNAIGTIVMGHPIDIYQQALIQLRTVALLLMLFLIIPSILLGYLLASTATNPIENLAQKMQKISTENLSERVEVSSKSLETFNLIRNFNKLLDRINESFNREKQFIGEVAHEIKTPLAVIKSNAQVSLSKERSTEEYKSSLSQVLTHVEKLSKRLSSLIDFAWSQTVDVQKQFSKINISNILNEICESAQYLGETKKINVDCDIKNDVFVLGKEDKLSQVFYNIIDNAVKYTGEEGRISIKLSKEENNAVVKIIDTGIGIDKEDLKTIFNRFYRSESNKNIRGHGLGLAIANSIIKAHNGNIEVNSIKNGGSTFTVSIPLSS